ncbi:AAA domain-containing protein [Desulfovibrio subterraneus]|uniref:AAA domain-containing protein n=1 Tax=Desulfovibrio subterraneus TaxID=2718620 RepID=UPI0022B92FD8|nr:AAA domain-containing protein [Desulfovibrio subterraneus]WBF66787.1 AAA domain-containing protein [Desulfovibrio subterraneus]
MAGRPYISKGIDELETIFCNIDNDPIELETLLQELGFRTTKRATALQKKALHVYNSLTQETLAPAPLSQHSNEDTQPSALLPEELLSPTPTPSPTMQPSPKLPITNTPVDILKSWTALEVLSPQGFKREVDLVGGITGRIARIDEQQLPWEKGESAPPQRRLYYELILGTIALEPTISSLLSVYADKRPDSPCMKGHSPIASILLDKNGCPIEMDMGFVFSSFAWGVPVALRGDLTKLADWNSYERQLSATFKHLLIQRNDDGEILPLTRKRIDDLFNFTVSEFGIQCLELKSPYFAIRRYEYYASKTPPEISILNSFYLEDLATAQMLAEKQELPTALRYYLGASTPARRIDLLHNFSELRSLLQPSKTPICKWPGKGRFPLAILQQAAVNATAPELLHTGILAVNGPPGTGKTTLLRDIITSKITERAEILCKFNKPAQAFTATKQQLQRSGAKITLHKLDLRLKGFEILVASSNNKAVENISAELPSLDSVANDASELRYFKAISDSVLGCNTWGLIAAVLGNSSNRYSFSQKFWRDEENSLSTYLNHASGLPQFAIEPQESSPPTKRLRAIIEQENPPSTTQEAQTRWDKARRNYLEISERAKHEQTVLQQYHDKLVRIYSIHIEQISAQTKQTDLETALQKHKEDIQRAEESISTINSKLLSIKTAIDIHQNDKPKLLTRIFKPKTYRSWITQQTNLEAKSTSCEREAEANERELNCIKDTINRTQTQLTRVLGSINTLQDELSILKAFVENNRNTLDAQVPDEDFFDLPPEEIQKANVWFSCKTNLLRDRVFEAAMQLHRAFIDSAADAIRQNISIFIESFGTRSLGNPEKDALLPDLLATFFLVVPVVSTTFASVHKMLSRLEPETIGWLLVDEAGQAVPQAAVGALLKAKKTVIVGDPLQIEPVVTLPNTLTERICEFFGIDPLKYNAPEASVQTIADSASTYCAKFPMGSGYRDVGSPLLVHRRCSSPMFDISNEIAYANLMVQAKHPSTKDPVLGASAWFHVQGESGPDKWCAREADLLLFLLGQLKTEGRDADLYIITPFVIIQDNLRKKILASGILNNWATNPNAWVYEHIGTVHTVQGREAGIVFFVLGAQNPAQNGARAWAGGRPNLVNVAVTRAKESLYVIGNRTLWKSVGVFTALDRWLPEAPLPTPFT